MKTIMKISIFLFIFYISVQLSEIRDDINRIIAEVNILKADKSKIKGKDILEKEN